MIGAWIQAARPLAHANIFAPLLLGQAAAYALTGHFSWKWAFVSHGLGLVQHLVIIFWNDFADAEGDVLNEAPTIFSGGSRVIVEGKLSREAVGRAATLSTVVLVSGAVVVSLDARPLALFFIVLGLVLVQLYSFAPARLSYRGHGEGLQALGLGVVLPGLGFYLQAGTIDSLPWLVIGGATLYGYAGNILTALPDVVGDRRAGKRSFVVRHGERPSRAVFIGIVLAASVIATYAAPASLWARLVVGGVPILFAAVASLSLSKANASDRTSLLRFVFAGGAAIQAGLLAWAIVLFVSER